MRLWPKNTTPHANTSETGQASLFVPEAIEVGARQLQIGDEWVASFAITGYPREVYPGWLHPLLTYPARLDVSVHIAPIDPHVAADRLRKQLAKFESSRAHTDARGGLVDPQAEAATDDAHALSEQLARGQARLFRLGLVLTVHASSQQELAEQASAVRALASSLLLQPTPTTYRALAGWVSTLPLGLDQIEATRTLDTAALAASFPFTSPDVPAGDPTSAATSDGVLYGLNLGSQSLVHWDRFARENYNAVILGRSGAGKSYFVKLETLRSLYRGVQVAIIDPEDEYARLARAIGGTHLPLGADVRINPLELGLHTRHDGRRTAPADALARRSLFCHTLLPVLLGQSLSAEERAVLDTAVLQTYAQAGITDNPRSWTQPAPVLADLRASLAATESDTARGLAEKLQPFTDGAYSGLFDGPSTTEPDGPLVVFSLKHLPEELKPAGTLLVLDAVWRRITQPASHGPRLCVVDEAWLLMHQQAGAEFLWRVAKSARKHWCGLTVATQDVADMLSSELGTAVITNAATQILLRQAPQTINEITRTFALSAGERDWLTSADTGHGLLASGRDRVAFQALASPGEHELITTDPSELAAHARPEPEPPHAERAERESSARDAGDQVVGLARDASGDYILDD